MSVNQYQLAEVVLTVAICIFVLASFAGIAVGIGLNISSARTLDMLRAANRRVFTRKQPGLMVTQAEAGASAQPKHRWSATTLFLLGGGYTVIMVLYVVEFPYVIAAMSSYAQPVVVEMLVTFVKWFLLCCGVAAIGVGCVKLGSAGLWPALQIRLNDWRWSRDFRKNANEMHMTLDNLVENHPRSTGLALMLLSAFALMTALAALMGA